MKRLKIARSLPTLGNVSPSLASSSNAVKKNNISIHSATNHYQYAFSMHLDTIEHHLGLNRLPLLELGKEF